MIVDECHFDAPAATGLQSLSCIRPMVATAMVVIGFSLQSKCIPPFDRFVFIKSTPKHLLFCFQMLLIDLNDQYARFGII